jgi:hypothetical protein
MPMRDEQALWCVVWGKRATEARYYPDGYSLHRSLEDAEEYQQVNLTRSMAATQWQGEPRVLLQKPYRCVVTDWQYRETMASDIGAHFSGASPVPLQEAS